MVVSPRAERDLKRLRRQNPNDYERVMAAICSLSNNPRPPGAKPLTGRRGSWSLRAGDYRVIYTIDEARAVTVHAESTPEGGVSREVSEGHYDGYLGGRWSAWSRHDIVVARVPEWLVAEHHSAPTGRAPGRPNGAKD